MFSGVKRSEVVDCPSGKGKSKGFGDPKRKSECAPSYDGDLSTLNEREGKKERERGSILCMHLCVWCVYFDWN